MRKAYCVALIKKIPILNKTDNIKIASKVPLMSDGYSRNSPFQRKWGKKGRKEKG